MSPTFDELVSGDGPTTEAVTRREDARYMPRHAAARPRHARIQGRPWPYRWHLVLGILTGALAAATGWTYGLIIWGGGR